MQDKRMFVSLLQQSVRDYQSHTSMFMNASENKKKNVTQRSMRLAMCFFDIQQLMAQFTQIHSIH